MKREALIKKFDTQVEKIRDCLDNIATLLEADSDDDYLVEMSVIFRDQVEYALSENEECNANNITEYIKANL